MRSFGRKKEEKLRKKEEEEKAEKAKIAEIKLKEKEKEVEALAKKNNYYVWLKAIFGGLLFFGSTASMYFLIKYKKNFMNSK